MKRWLPFLVIFLVGCGPKAPDSALILWSQPAPQIAAQAHAKEIGGLALLINGTSMTPFLVVGDWITVDIRVGYDAIKVKDLVIYQASWLPPQSPVVCHMVAAKSGDEFIMDGIANEHYENGTLRMKRADYCGKVVQVYTKRAKA